jgi:hypothetical protein
MSISSFNVNPVDIASANLGWLVAQMLLGTLVTKKIIEAKDAQDILNFCRQRYIQGHRPERAEIRDAVLECLGPVILLYDVTPQDQKH